MSQNPCRSILRFYRDGFRSMTVGRVLWMVVLIKLFVIFVVVRMLFFPRFLSRFDTEEAKQNFVSKELIQRAK